MGPPLVGNVAGYHAFPQCSTDEFMRPRQLAVMHRFEKCDVTVYPPSQPPTLSQLSPSHRILSLIAWERSRLELYPLPREVALGRIAHQVRACEKRCGLRKRINGFVWLPAIAQPTAPSPVNQSSIGVSQSASRCT